MPVESKEIREM